MEWRIRDVVYGAEDTIDPCTTLVEAEKNTNFMRQAVNAKRDSLAQLSEVP